MTANPNTARPVAWRWRNPGGVWNYQEAEQRIPGVEQEPLYSAPASPAVGLEEAVGLREALRDLSSAASKVFNKLANGRYATRGELQNILRGPIDKAQAAFLTSMESRDV